MQELKNEKTKELWKNISELVGVLTAESDLDNYYSIEMKFIQDDLVIIDASLVNEEELKKDKDWLKDRLESIKSFINKAVWDIEGTLDDWEKDVN